MLKVYTETLILEMFSQCCTEFSGMYMLAWAVQNKREMAKKYENCSGNLHNTIIKKIKIKL